MQPNHVFRAHDSYVIALAYTSGGGSLFSAGMDNVVHSWDAGEWGRMTTFVEHEKSVNCFALTPDGQTLITGSSDATVRLWDIRTQEARHILQDRQRVVAALALSSDAWWIAAGSYKGRVAVWDLEGKVVTGFPASKGNITAVAFHPTEGHVLATAGLGSDIRVWHLPDADEIATLPVTTAAVATARFTPDGRYLLALTYEGYLRVWDARTGTALPQLHVDLTGARTFALNAQGDRCAVLYEGRAEIRSFPGWAIQASLDMDAKVLNAAAFSPSSGEVAIGGADGKIRIYQIGV